MGREVRMVPKHWIHPRDERGTLKPLHDGCTYAAAVEEWNDDVAERGLQGAIEWNGPGPDARDYMPEWSDAEADYLMMYENTSEGTPISPAFRTPEDLARWLADNNASAFAGMTATYDQWLATVRAGSAPSAVMGIDPDGLVSGVAFMAIPKDGDQ